MEDPSGPPEPGEGRSDELAQLAATSAQQLDSVRGTAENWKTGLAGLLALVTTLLFLKGRDAVGDIDRSSAVVIAIILVVALFVAVAATWCALRAAYGVPQTVTLTSLRSHGGIEGYRAGRAEQSLRDLNWARCLSLGATFLFAGAIVAYWFAPAARDPQPGYLEIRTRDGRSLCGRLEPAPPEMVTLRDAHGVAENIRPSDITALVMHAINDCGRGGS